jgi:hypothetical protein
MIPNPDAKIIMHAPLCRETWGRLYYFLRGGDPQGSGHVTTSWAELLEFFSVDSSTLYRWLQDGRQDRAFRSYSRTGDLLSVWLGSKQVIALSLGLASWGAATVIDRAELAAPDWRDLVTAEEAYWQQRRSKTAALNTARIGGKRKPQVAKIRFVLRRGKAGQPPLQFLRNKIPFGCNQVGIGRRLNITDRTVRRHLTPVSRVQQVHKIPYQEGWIAIKIAKETGTKPTCFIRGNEAFKFGCNIYDLEFEQRSEKTQRLKYLYFLCKIWRRRGAINDKSSLSFVEIEAIWNKSIAADLSIEDFIEIRSFDTFRKTLLAGLHLRRDRQKKQK